MAIIDGKIRCSVCREMIATSGFAPSMQAAGNGVCRACRRAVYKKPISREKQKCYNLRRYGLRAAEYYQLLEHQSGACACCGAKKNSDGRALYVDHDHATGEIRGLLCYACNTGIGALKDSVAGVQQALAYLTKTDSKPLLSFSF